MGVGNGVNARTAMKTLGLTSPGNKAFTEATGLYDQVLTYDEVAKVT
ncbi:MAG: DUF2855 family protein, partial [Pseudomonadota bacterium]